MSGMTRISTLGFLLVALAAGCQSAGEKPPAQERGTPQVARVDQDGVQRINVVAGSYFFSDFCNFLSRMVSHLQS